jgi:drug/metabolite transporter (DMT)-like permease
MSTLARTAPDKTLTVAGLLGLFALGWSVAEWLPMQLKSEFSLFQVVWVRYATHLLFMLIVLMPRYGRSLWQTQRPALQLGRGLLMLIMPASYIFSLGHVRGGDVLAFFWLTPLCILAFAAIVQRDRAPWPLWAAALATSLGALMIIRPSPAVADAALFGLGMALSFSLYVVLTRSLRDEPTLVNLFYSALAVFVPLTFALPSFWQPLTIYDTLIMAAIGFVGLVVLWALDKACEIASVNIFAPLFTWQLLLYLPIFALAGGVGKLALAGAVLIAVTTAFVLHYSTTILNTTHSSQDIQIKVESA